MLFPLASPVAATRRVALYLACLLLVSLTGCRSPQAASPTSHASTAVRDDSYSLLYELMSQERNIDKLLMLKNEAEDVGELIVEIAQFCQDTAEELKQYA